VKTSLLRTLQILFRQKWLILTFFLATVVLINLASYTLPPTYVATAQFLVVPGAEQLPIYTSSGTVVDRGSPTLRTETIISEMELVHARPVIERVVDRIGLDNPNAIALGEATGPNAPRAATGFVKKVGEAIGKLNADIHNFLVDMALVNVVDPREGTIDGLQKSLSVTPVFSSNVFSVSYAYTDPRLAAMVVNTVAEEYLNYRQDVYKPPGVVDHFREQVEIRKAELDAAREHLRAYQDKYNIVNLETEIDNALRNLEDAKKGNTLSSQREQYAARLEVLRAAAPVIRDLRFEVENAQQLYERYSAKFDEVSSNAELDRAKFANVRMIETAAVDWTPVFPHRLLNLYLSIFLGILGGIGLALAANYFSDKIHAVEDIEAISLRALGSVPLLRKRRDRQNAYAAARCRSACSLIAEQLRVQGGARGLAVRGTHPGVGCSTVAIGLATSLAAESEQRVLLVDANILDPAIHHAFDADQEPPISNDPGQKLELPELIQRGDRDNLDILTAARFKLLHQSDPGVMHRLLDELSGKYTFVLVDTPPLFSSASPLKGVDGWSAILVVAARRTSIQVVRRAVDVLGRQGFAVLGAVLNKREDSLPGFLYRRL
jgi:uncharacterized protein involved in exopolysaccharide biosynthesis/Mrp family chromosome partitioning ATPase